MSNLRKTFAQAVGGIAAVTIFGVGAAAVLSYATEDSGTSVTPSSQGNSTSQKQSTPDIYFNLKTPMFDDVTYSSDVASTEASLQSKPEIVNIAADDSQETVDQIIQQLKANITENGGPLNRIIIGTDGQTNELADPLPKHKITYDAFGDIVAIDGQTDNLRDVLSDGCTVQVPDLPQYAFCSTSLTSILHAMVDLQNQDFPGHKAGQPLGQAIDIASCDVFATNNSGEERLPAREISQLAAQLNMPVIASASLVSFNSNYSEPKTGDFWAILPNGNVSYLDGPRTQIDPRDPNYSEFIKDDIAANEAWIRDDGFTFQNVTEPVENYPFSLIDTPEIAAVAVAGPAANSNGPEVIPHMNSLRIVSVGPVRKAGPGMG